MKNILKYAVVLLLLFAMIGTASAAVDSISIGEPTLNESNYDVLISWTGTLESEQFDITILPGDFSDLSNENDGSVLFTEAFVPGTEYTVTVTDGESSKSDKFTIPALPPSLESPAISNFKSDSDSTDTQLSVSWDWTQQGTETLQITANGTWINVTDNTAMINGNNSSDTIILIRAMEETAPDTFIYSNPVTAATLNPVEITKSANTTDSITWTLSGWTDYVDYTVTGNVNGDVAPGNLNLAGDTLTANNLVGGETYTLKIRGTGLIDAVTCYSLFGSNGFELAAPKNIFIDTFEPNENDAYYDSDLGEDQKPFSIESGKTLRFNITTTDDSSFKWELLFDDDGTNVTVTDQTTNTTTDNKVNEFSWRPSAAGTYYLSLVITDETSSEKQTLKWKVTVTKATSGDRIWDASLGMPTDKYEWNGRTYSGFFYDMDTGDGNETMVISNIGRSISKGDIVYTTTVADIEYEYDDWGSYQVVGFMGDKYFAGSGAGSLMRGGNLSKILMDNDDRENYRVGQYITLEEGYAVRIDQIDVNGNAALLVVEKDGKSVSSSVVNASGNGTFIYEKNISNVKVPFIMIHVSSVFMGSESSLVTVDGIFQISDNLTRLESGTKIDKMEIRSVSATTIVMRNEDSVSLSQDTEVTLMGKMKFIVADTDYLKFAPTIEYTDPGIYEIRGTVSDFSNEDFIVPGNVWTPLNFEGFYYDINDDISDSESITIKSNLGNSSRSIGDGELVYTANVTTVEYEYSDWKEYDIIGFMGEKYYAGYDGTLLNTGNLSKVLIDEAEQRRMSVGQSLALEEGVSIKVTQIDVNGNRAQLIVEQDGKEIFSDIVQSGEFLNYSKKIGSGSNTTFIRVQVDSVFMGTESSLVMLSGIFQASTNLTKIEDGTKYGKMEITDYSRNGIVLKNDGSITLSAGNDVEFMKVGNTSMYFKVGDNDTLRFAPVVEQEIGSTDPLNVKLSNSTVVSGDVVTITVEDRGVTIEGVTVTINGSTVGTTNSSGQVNYTTNAVGTFRVNAEKSGYTAGNASLTVNEKLINMTVRVSPETVYFGTAGTIKATDSLNGSAISDATVYISGESIGRTNSSGELNYTFNKTGTVTIDVAKEKYNNGTTTVNVSQEVAFAYSNFALKPDEPSAKKAIKLSFDVTNNGIKDGSHDVSLILKDGSGNVIDRDNKTVSANMGKTKSVSLSVKAPEEGTYTLTLVESDSNRTIDLPSSMSNVSVGSAKLGSTILYVILAFLAIIVLAVIGFVAYLFGVKGANRDNYKMVASEVVDDIKYKFQRK